MADPATAGILASGISASALPAGGVGIASASALPAAGLGAAGLGGIASALGPAAANALALTGGAGGLSSGAIGGLAPQLAGAGGALGTAPGAFGAFAPTAAPAAAPSFLANLGKSKDALSAVSSIKSLVGPRAQQGQSVGLTSPPPVLGNQGRGFQSLSSSLGPILELLQEESRLNQGGGRQGLQNQRASGAFGSGLGLLL